MYTVVDLLSEQGSGNKVDLALIPRIKDEQADDRWHF